MLAVVSRADSAAPGRRIRAGATRRMLEAILRERRRLLQDAPSARTAGPDPGDVAQVVEVETTWLAVLERERDLHDQAEQAMQRLAEGRYGDCAACGGRIPPVRLRALPFAVRCRPCQERFEAEARCVAPSRPRAQAGE